MGTPADAIKSFRRRRLIDNFLGINLDNDASAIDQSLFRRVASAIDMSCRSHAAGN